MCNCHRLLVSRGRAWACEGTATRKHQKGLGRALPGTDRKPVRRLAFASASVRSHTAGGATIGRGGLGTRRQRFWFALIGIVALALPYATAIVAAIRAEIDAPAAPAVIPTLALPTLRAPQVAVPKLV